MSDNTSGSEMYSANEDDDEFFDFSSDQEDVSNNNRWGFNYCSIKFEKLIALAPVLYWTTLKPSLKCEKWWDFTFIFTRQDFSKDKLVMDVLNIVSKLPILNLYM